MKIGIINVTGYAGIELARILYRHPEAEVVSVTGRSQAGEALGDALPHLSRMAMTIEPEITRSVDMVFSALPQVASAEACLPFVRDGVKVVDISADFRLHDASEYALWYGSEHPAPDLLETSVYGSRNLIGRASQARNSLRTPAATRPPRCSRLPLSSRRASSASKSSWTASRASPARAGD